MKGSERMTKVRKNRISFNYLLVGLLVLGLTLSGCTSPAGEAPSEDGEDGPTGPIKIGILLPATGDLAQVGQPMIAAGQVAAQAIKDAGGVLGREVDAVVMDTATEENTAREGMDQLANLEQVAVVVGAAGSGNSFAALSVAQPAQVVMISPSSTSPDFTNYNDNGYFFRTAPSDALQGKVMAQLALAKGYTKAATLALNNQYGEAFKNVFVEAFEAAGGEIVADVLYDPQGVTFDGDVAKIAQAAPECVILVSYPETGSIILRTAYQQGLLDTAEFILSEGVQSDELAETVGKDAQGNYIIAGIQGTRPKATGPAYDLFVERSQAMHGEGPSGPFDAHTYDAVILAFLAIEKAGESSGPAIKEALLAVASPPGVKVSDPAEALKLIREGKDIDYEGASGNVNMDEVGDVLSAYEVWEIQPDGSVEAVGDVVPE